MRLLRTSALALLLIPAAVAAGPRRSWDFGMYSHIHRVPAEPGAAPNAHPAQVEPAVLSQALATLRYTAKGPKDLPLFFPAELEPLCKALSEALSLAGPGEDLVMISTHKRDGGFLGEALAVAARIFVQDGRLNIIVQDPRLDWVYAYNYDNRMPPFDYGSRTKPGPTVLKAAVNRRPDWAVLTLAAPAAQPAPAPAPAVAAAPAKPVNPSVEERLKGLKRFREQELITEAEYVRQKEELLKEYASGKKD